jgi:pimeloyl-ACP methyl ester carboxylesterase
MQTTQVVDERSTSRFVQAGDVRIHYHDVGTGDPVIMLHGTGPGASSWSNFRGNVAAFSEKFRAVLVDMPQYGKSQKVVIEGGRLSYTSKVLRDFMDAVGIERAHFVGNSMGGQVAIKLAIDSPERVDKLVVIGSNPVSYSLFSPMPLEGIKHIAGYYRGEGGPSLEKLRRLFQTILFDQSFLDEDALRERYEASIEPEVIELMTRTPPANQDLTAELHQMKSACLIIWGADDRLGALDVGLLMLRRFPNARMHIFNRCGHWAQVEHADAFNRLVIDFLANG